MWKIIPIFFFMAFCMISCQALPNPKSWDVVEGNMTDEHRIEVNNALILAASIAGNDYNLLAASFVDIIVKENPGTDWIIIINKNPDNIIGHYIGLPYVTYLVLQYVGDLYYIYEISNSSPNSSTTPSYNQSSPPPTDNPPNNGSSVPKPICNTGWIYFSDKCYEVSKNNLTYEDANSRCNELDSTILSVDSFAENGFLVNVILKSFGLGSIWLGGDYDEDQWVWKSGAVFGIQNWRNSTEKDVNDSDGKLSLNINGFWSTVDPSEVRSVVCQQYAYIQY